MYEDKNPVRFPDKKKVGRPPKGTSSSSSWKHSSDSYIERLRREFSRMSKDMGRYMNHYLIWDTRKLMPARLFNPLLQARPIIPYADVPFYEIVLMCSKQNIPYEDVKALFVAMIQATKRAPAVTPNKKKDREPMQGIAFPF